MHTAGSSRDHHLSSSLTTLDSTQTSSQGDNILGRVLQQVLYRIRTPRRAHLTEDSAITKQLHKLMAQEEKRGMPMSHTMNLEHNTANVTHDTRAGKAVPQGLTLDRTQQKKPQTRWEKLGEIES